MSTATIQQTEWNAQVNHAIGFDGPARGVEVMFRRSKSIEPNIELEMVKDDFYSLPEVREYEAVRQETLRLDDTLVALKNEIETVSIAIMRGDTLKDSEGNPADLAAKRDGLHKSVDDSRAQRERAFTRTRMARDAATKAWANYIAKRRTSIKAAAGQALNSAQKRLADAAKPVLDEMERCYEAIEMVDTQEVPGFSELAGNIGVPDKSPA